VTSWERRFAGLPASERDGLRVYEASSGRARLRGLAGLDDLPPGLALHLPRTRSVHTFGMRFPLDLTWLDGAGRVVRVDRDVPRGRLRTCLRAKSVIEARARYSEPR
jgi:uncharacterized membrane protein (UPF0127 family)